VANHRNVNDLRGSRVAGGLKHCQKHKNIGKLLVQIGIYVGLHKNSLFLLKKATEWSIRSLHL
jgi:hypothetical protein